MEIGCIVTSMVVYIWCPDEVGNLRVKPFELSKRFFINILLFTEDKIIMHAATKTTYN